MSNEHLLERLARAIVAATGADPEETRIYVYDRPGGPPGNALVPAWRLFIPQARSALAEIEAAGYRLMSEADVDDVRQSGYDQGYDMAQELADVDRS